MEKKDFIIIFCNKLFCECDIDFLKMWRFLHDQKSHLQANKYESSCEIDCMFYCFKPTCTQFLVFDNKRCSNRHSNMLVGDMTQF